MGELEKTGMIRAFLLLVGLGALIAGGFVLWRTGNSLPAGKAGLSTSSSISQATPGPSPLPPTPTPTPSPSPSPSPTPSPDPKVYGPCKIVPVLLYHHIEPKEEALAAGQKNIFVDNTTFAGQLEYLVKRGYKTITPDELVAGLASGSVGAKNVLLTFDDGYEDFYTYAYPTLVKNGMKATSFVPTGLVGNPGYLNWGQIAEMKGSGLITFANHTWSHKNVGGGSEETIRREITTAQTQLVEHGLGPITAFAYPYGPAGGVAKKVLQELSIKSAFTTNPSWYQCAKLPYDFGRTRVGDTSMSFYGL